MPSVSSPNVLGAVGHSVGDDEEGEGTLKATRPGDDGNVGRKRVSGKGGGGRRELSQVESGF